MAPLPARPSFSKAFVPWVLLFLIGQCSAAMASEAEAARRVRQGIRQFRAGDLDGAAKEFAEADVALPEDARVAFDQACVSAAKNDTEKALELFRKAAQSREVELAAGAHYNLGCISAAKAKAALGPQPETATPETRQQVLADLEAAVSHYRDCLELDRSHVEARHNLEVIRQWIKHMREVWSKRDREQQRKNLNLLQMIEWLRSEEQGLRAATRALSSEKDSPRKRQAVHQLRSKQQELAGEAEPLKEKIRESLAAPPGDPNQPNAQPQPVPEETEKAIGILQDIADKMHETMVKAGKQLQEQQLEEAAASQRGALESIEEMYLGVAPFPQLVTAALGLQKSLLDRTESPAPENTDARKTQDTQRTSVTSADPQNDVNLKIGAVAISALDRSELTWEESIVGTRSEMMRLKAEHELKALPTKEDNAPTASPQTTPPAPAGPALPPGYKSPSSQPAPGPNAQTSPTDANSPVAHDMRPALEKAVELGPRITELTRNAKQGLEEDKFQESATFQKQALDHLQEIADLLPKQPQQNDQQDKDQQDKDQENRDQQNNDQQKDQQQSPQQPSSDRQEKPQQRPEDQKHQSAEAIMRKVRERDRKHREAQKRLLPAQRAGVDKDW